MTWLTGFFQPVQLGMSPAAGGPPLAWYEDGQCTLVVMDGLKSEAEQTGCNVVTYPGMTVEEPLEGAARLARVLKDLLQRSGQRNGKLGVEVAVLPAYLFSLVEEILPDADLVAVDGWLDPLRRIKTDEELAMLRENFDLTGVGHAAARRAIQPGKREIDVWTEVQSAIEQAAGQRLPLGNDCVVGYRQNNIGGAPLNYPIQPGNSLIVDISTLKYGYWSDSCATYYAGEPSERQAAIHTTVARALDLAISLIEPGAVAKDIDRQIRRFISSAGYPVYPHHSGHGVGLTGHEEPRIVPYNDMRIEPGMVIMLEPGIYIPGEIGVRLEDAVLVTTNGAEVLTHHDKSLPH